MLSQKINFSIVLRHGEWLMKSHSPVNTSIRGLSKRARYTVYPGREKWREAIKSIDLSVGSFGQQLVQG